MRGHDPAVLVATPYMAMTKGQRIAAVKLGIVPPVRSERERQLRSRYRLLLEDYDALLAEQKGACAVCREVWTNDLYVDHHHPTGQIRGLLCARCNSLVGALESDPVLVAEAATYVAWHNRFTGPHPRLEIE